MEAYTLFRTHIVSHALESDPMIVGIRKSCRDIVSYFHRSSLATDKLKSTQVQLNLDQHKLIQEVETRWNSSFYMFERLVEQHEAVTTALCLLGKNVLCLSAANVEILKELRLKKCAFGADDTVAIDKILRSIKAELVHAVSSHENSTSTEFTDEMEDQGEVEETTLAVGQSGGDETLWQFVDQRVAETSRVRTPTVDATVEVDQYMKQKNIARKEDPLVWWQNKNVYPNLQYLARKYLSVPATSVSSERLFSKAGELISARRSTLKEKNINMYLFLNKNLKILQ